MATQGFTQPVLGPDLMSKQFKLQQDIEMIKAALAAGQRPNEGKMVSGHWVPPDMGRAVSNAFSSFAGMKGMQELPDRMADLSRSKQGTVNSILGAMLGQQVPEASAPGMPAGGAPTAGGVPSMALGNSPQTFPIGPSGAPPMGQPLGGAPASQPPSPAGLQGMSPKQAAAMAIASGIPELVKIGESILTGGVTSLVPGQVTIDKLGNVVDVARPDGKPNFETVSIGGDLYQKTSTGLKKLDNAPKTNVSVSMNPAFSIGNKAGAIEAFKGAAKKLDELGTLAGTASNMKQTLAEMRQLDENGLFSNVTSGPATWINNLAQVAGVPVDVNKLGNTEAFQALSTDIWQGLVSKFGGNRGVTAEEAAQIKKMVPLTSSSPQARQQLYNMLENVADRQIKQYQSAGKAFGEATYAEDPRMLLKGFQDIYTAPPQDPSPVTRPTGAPPAGPISLDEYLERSRVGGK